MNTTRRDFLKVGAGVVAATSADSADSNDGFSSIASGRSAAATARDVELHCSVLKLVGSQCVAFCLRDQCEFMDLQSVGINDQERDAAGMVPQTVPINIKIRS